MKLYGLLLVLVATVSAHLHAQSAKKSELGPVHVAKVSGFSDQAAFLFYLNGNLILTNFVTWSDNGNFESKGEGIAEGDKIRMATTVSSDAAGYWREVSMEMPIHKTSVKCMEDTALVTLPNGKAKTVSLKPGVFPFVGMVGLNLYTRFYDESKGGKQSLPILIPHKKAQEISLERKRQFQRALAGKKLELREFVLKAGDLNALVWIDERGRLMRVRQPEEGAVFIRQGYEALREER